MNQLSREECLETLNNGGHVQWDAVSEDVRDDKELMLKAVSLVGDKAWELLSETLQNDVDFMLKFLKAREEFFEKINRQAYPLMMNLIYDRFSDALKQNREFNKGLISLQPAFFPYIDGYRNDEEIALIAISQNRDNFRYSGEKILKNVELAKRLGIEENWPYDYLACLKQELGIEDGKYRLDYGEGRYILRNAPEQIRNHREYVKGFVQLVGGNALEFASEELRNDKEIVELAMKNDVLAFIYASEELQGDEEIFGMFKQKVAKLRALLSKKELKYGVRDASEFEGRPELVLLEIARVLDGQAEQSKKKAGKKSRDEINPELDQYVADLFKMMDYSLNFNEEFKQRMKKCKEIMNSEDGEPSAGSSEDSPTNL